MPHEEVVGICKYCNNVIYKGRTHRCNKQQRGQIRPVQTPRTQRPGRGGQSNR